jgi:riboflavin synthase
MFTGLIEGVGRVVAADAGRGTLRLSIALPAGIHRLRAGDSVCVDGVCLTVAAATARRFQADVVRETLARTTLARARAGLSVNLERALRVGSRLGGHWVQGHVDGTATVQRIGHAAGDHRLRVGLDRELRRYVALKGAIALQGVSLTVAALARSWFEVALVPQTLERTTLGRFRAGDRLNVEVDLVARYLERLCRT